MAQAEVCKTFYAGSIPAAASQEHSPSTTKERLVATVSVRYIVVRNDVVVGTGGKQVMFQNVAHYTAPRWPDPAHPQQVHLDVQVDYREIAALEEKVLALGATRLPGEGENWRVYADPAGHPFCLTG